jgi:hypothetical protein
MPRKVKIYIRFSKGLTKSFWTIIVLLVLMSFIANE